MRLQPIIKLVNPVVTCFALLAHAPTTKFWPVFGGSVEPCLAAALKIDISIVREFLSREEFHMNDVPQDASGMSTGLVMEEFISAWCRLLDLLARPGDIPFLSGLIEREIMYRVLRGPEGARLRAIATLGNQSHRTAKPIAWIKTNYAKPLRVEELAEVAGMAVSTFHIIFGR